MRSQDLLDERVILAPNYRVFLKESLEVLRQKRNGYSLTVFANKSGLASRGFIVDVIKEKKRLTVRSTPKAAKGLGLNGKLKNLFFALVESDESGNSDRVEKLRSQLLSQLRQTESENTVSSKTIYSDLNFLIVYAALGTEALGATKEEILSRTSLSEDIVTTILQKMMHEKILRTESERFIAVNSHLVFENMRRDQGFQKVFLDSMKLAREQAMRSMDSDQKLFFHAVVPAKKMNLSKMKIALKTALTEFIHENQNDEGDQVVQVQLAFF